MADDTVQDGTLIRVENFYQDADSAREALSPTDIIPELVRNAVVRATTAQRDGRERLSVVVHRRNGQLACADNGVGLQVAEFNSRLGGIGSSGRGRKSDMAREMGQALKIAPFFNPRGGLRFTSIAEGFRIAHTALTARLDTAPAEDEYEIYGFREAPRRVDGALRVPVIGDFSRGAIVELGDTEFDAEEVVRSLNGHFRGFPEWADVLVHDGRRTVPIVGFEALAKNLVEELHDGWDGETFSAQWGFVRKDLPRDVRAVWDGIPLRVMWGSKKGREERVPAYSLPIAEGGRGILGDIGIPVGGENILIIVFPKPQPGKKIRPTRYRDALQGWRFTDAVREMAQTIPDELFAWAQDRLQAHISESSTSEAVRRKVMDELRAAGIKRMPSMRLIDSDAELVDGDDESERESSGSSGGKGGTRKKKRRSEGEERSQPTSPQLPTFEVVRDVLGTLPYAWDASRHAYLVNGDYPAFAEALAACKKSSQVHRITVSFVAHLMRGDMRFRQREGKVPTEGEVKINACAWEPPFRVKKPA